MSNSSSIVTSLLICVAAAGLEGICAGKNVKAFFNALHRPKYSAPLWVWSIIGAVYYAIFGFVLYRLLRLDGAGGLRSVAIAVVIAMMILNALSNYVIFRAGDLRRSFLIGAVFPIFDLALLALLVRLDSLAALSLVPYLIYRVYGVYWGYAVWKANPGRIEQLAKQD